MSCRLLVRSVLVSVVWTASLPSDMRRVEYVIPCTRAMIQLKTGCSLRILMKADGMLGAIKATSTWSSKKYLADKDICYCHEGHDCVSKRTSTAEKLPTKMLRQKTWV